MEVVKDVVWLVWKGGGLQDWWSDNFSFSTIIDVVIIDYSINFIERERGFAASLSNENSNSLRQQLWWHLPINLMFFQSRKLLCLRIEASTKKSTQQNNISRRLKLFFHRRIFLHWIIRRDVAGGKKTTFMWWMKTRERWWYKKKVNTTKNVMLFERILMKFKSQSYEFCHHFWYVEWEDCRKICFHFPSQSVEGVFKKFQIKGLEIRQ